MGSLSYFSACGTPTSIEVKEELTFSCWGSLLDCLISGRTKIALLALSGFLAHLFSVVVFAGFVEEVLVPLVGIIGLLTV